MQGPGESGSKQVQGGVGEGEDVEGHLGGLRMPRQARDVLSGSRGDPAQGFKQLGDSSSA